MSANTSLAIRIAAIFDNKGLKQADKGVKGLQSSVKKLAGAAGLALTTAAVINFGKKAAKAFIADEKAASQLAVSVKNLGLAFETPRIEEFISNLSKASGVADDVLRPAMQKLLQTTGSVAKSTELLTQALDISRGSGVDYETVVNDLTMAYVGQTKGLSKYKLGLTKAELATMSFTDIQKKLGDQFKGANAAYLDTFAGKMEVLGVAAGEASEIIGKGLIDALMILSGDTTVEDLAVTMSELATNTANVITELAKLGKAVANFATESYGKVDDTANGITDFLDRLTGNEERIAARNRSRMGGYPSSALGGAFVDPNDAARKKAEADAAKRAKELAALQKKTLDTQKKSLALQKASKTLNLDAIGIEAALKGKLSETDRLSLQLQKAILEGNATLATSISDQLDAAIKRNNELRLALLATPKAPNPFSEWSVPKLDFGGNMLGTPVPNFVPPAYAMPPTFGQQGGLPGGVVAGVNPAPPINIKVEVAGEAVAAVITQTQTNQSLSGSFVGTNRTARFGTRVDEG
jgi:hypothetical protein